MIVVEITPPFLVGQGVPLHVAESDAALFGVFCTHYEINTPNRVAHLMGQVMKEAGRGRFFSEIPSRFASSRLFYKGRGWPQLTGEANHRLLNGWLQDDAAFIESIVGQPVPNFLRAPEQLELAPWRVISACAYWHHDYANANQYADRGVTRTQVSNITTRVWRPAAAARAVDERYGYARTAKRLIDQGRGIRFVEASDTASADLFGGGGFWDTASEFASYYPDDPFGTGTAIDVGGAYERLRDLIFGREEERYDEGDTYIPERRGGSLLLPLAAVGVLGAGIYAARTDG
ncbi:MAG: hypothetical protein AAF791_05430 [Bacteroidota bacterium]